MSVVSWLQPKSLGWTLLLASLKLQKLRSPSGFSSRHFECTTILLLISGWDVKSAITSGTWVEIYHKDGSYEQLGSLAIYWSKPARYKTDSWRTWDWFADTLQGKTWVMNKYLSMAVIKSTHELLEEPACISFAKSMGSLHHVIQIPPGSILHDYSQVRCRKENLMCHGQASSAECITSYNRVRARP